MIAPDLPGFGKSDKPASGEDYTLSALVDRMALFFDQPAFHPCFLFAHDWGVVIGLILAVRHPDLFSGIIACNSFLPAPGFSLSPMLLLWQKVARYSPILPVGRIVDFATKRKLSRQERAGYDFPFTHEREKLAIRMLPRLITRNWSDPGVSMIEECRQKLGQLEMPFLPLFSKEDPLTRGGDKQLQAQIPGSRGQPHCLLNGKHFLQEYAPTELGLMISNFILQNR